jgi:hypothetical protein
MTSAQTHMTVGCKIAENDEPKTKPGEEGDRRSSSG